MSGNIRRLAGYLLLSFLIVTGGLTWWQVADARQLATRADNPQVIAAHRSALRGSIFDATGKVLASTTVADGLARRTYTDTAFTHVIGYASLRYGTTGLEHAYDDLLTGQADPNPLRGLLDDILARQPEPKDLSLTIDKRLQDFAAAQLKGVVGAVVAIDPVTGAILASTSTPTLRRDTHLRRSDGSLPADGDHPGKPEQAPHRPRPPGPLHPGVDHEGAHLGLGGPRCGRDHAADHLRRSAKARRRAASRSSGFTITEHDLGRTRPGALGPLARAPGLEQHLLRPRGPGAGRGPVPRVRKAASGSARRSPSGAGTAVCPSRRRG